MCLQVLQWCINFFNTIHRQYLCLYHPQNLITFRCFIVQHLESVIKAKIPGIIALINKGIEEMEAELDRLGRPIAVDEGVRSFCLYVIYCSFDPLTFVNGSIWVLFCHLFLVWLISLAQMGTC